MVPFIYFSCNSPERNIRTWCCRYLAMDNVNSRSGNFNKSLTSLFLLSPRALRWLEILSKRVTLKKFHLDDVSWTNHHHHVKVAFRMIYTVTKDMNGQQTTIWEWIQPNILNTSKKFNAESTSKVTVNYSFYSILGFSSQLGYLILLNLIKCIQKTIKQGNALVTHRSRHWKVWINLNSFLLPRRFPSLYFFLWWHWPIAYNVSTIILNDTGIRELPSPKAKKHMGILE